MVSNIEAYVISNIGNVRTNHEDNFYVPKNNYIDEKQQKDIKNNEINIESSYSGKDGVFVVCDGMGGHNAGEVASRMGVQAISTHYNSIIDAKKDDLLQFIKKLNIDICEYSANNPNCNNMGSTFSGLIIASNKMHLLHVGDSRIYCIKEKEIKQISKDHTEGCRLVDAGIIKKEDLPKFPNRKLLYKYLGREGELIADCEEVDIVANTRYIVASDGLSDTLTDDEIFGIASKRDSLKNICHELIEKCLQKGKTCSDNVTIICIDIK